MTGNILTPIELARPPVVEFGPGTVGKVGQWAEAKGLRRARRRVGTAIFAGRWPCDRQEIAMTETKHHPRRSAWTGRILGFLAVLLLLGGTLYVAQQNGTITVAQRNDNATTSNSDVPTPEGRRGAEPSATDPANRPPGAAATTGSSTSDPSRPSAPATTPGAPATNASPSNVAPR